MFDSSYIYMVILKQKQSFVMLLINLISYSYTTKSVKSQLLVKSTPESASPEAKADSPLKLIYQHILKELGPMIYHSGIFFIKKEIHYVSESYLEFQKRIKNLIFNYYH